VNLGPPINTEHIDSFACLSSDDLELYYTSDRPEGNSFNLWVATRPTRSEPWGPPERLGPTDIFPTGSQAPWITHDGLELYFACTRSGGSGALDLWVAARSTPKDDWGDPVNLGPIVNQAGYDCHPSLSREGLVLFFSGYAAEGLERPGGYGMADMWMSRRRSVSDPWEPPVNLGPKLNSSNQDVQPRLSPDGSMLYFTSWRRAGDVGGLTIWQAPIIPVVDFNGDGQVNGFEVAKMADRWGTSDFQCDIGPTPCGDGVVDTDDLLALARHIGKNVDDSTLIAHWALDETDGDVAHNGVSDNHGTLLGEPNWRPEDGIISGALGFDGEDDYIVTEHVLDPANDPYPAEGPFSVLAWIRGGAPGQVLISQFDLMSQADGRTWRGANWLMIDALTGTLVTELTPPPQRRKVPPLISDVVVTDNTWHRVAFVWDGVSRSLYVDDTLVAQDEQNDLQGCYGGLYIGCGTDRAPDTFFSGLIDDVRIYNRAVEP